MAADANAARLAFWARMVTGIKGAGMIWPGFSYTDAEWSRLEVLADQVSAEVAGAFLWLNAAVFIGLAAIVMFGVFLPLATVMFPDPANTRPLPFALLLASVCVLTLGVGLPLTMRMTAWLLATEKVRSRLASEPDDEALWAKVRFQMTRMTVIMCGLLVPWNTCLHHLQYRRRAADHSAQMGSECGGFDLDRAHLVPPTAASPVGSSTGSRPGHGAPRVTTSGR